MRRISFLLATALHGALLCCGALAADTIAARYELTHTVAGGAETEPSAWYYMRGPGRVETASADRAEVWQRAGNGAISLKRVFRAHRFVLEYTHAELAARGVKPDWEALGAIVAPAALRALEPDGTQSVLDRQAQVLRGQSDGEEVEIWWLAPEGLPALMRRTGPKGSFSMRLVELHGHAPVSWPSPAQWSTDNYRWVDAADLGDMEHDPEVERLLREEGGAR